MLWQNIVVGAVEGAGTGAVAVASAATGAVESVVAAVTGAAGTIAAVTNSAAVTNAATASEWVRIWKHTPHYFIGTHGVTAVILTALSMFWLIRYARRPERSVFYGRAILATAAAVVLAAWTWHDIGNHVEVDRSLEADVTRAFVKKVKEREAKTIKDRVKDIRFAEDSDADMAHVQEAGEKAESQKDDIDKALDAAAKAHEEAASADLAYENEADHAYRKTGKVRRERATNVVATVDSGAAAVEVKQESPWRVMVIRDKVRSFQYGNLLRMACWLGFWVALGCALLDYLSRFNKVFDYFFPLPLSLLWLDRILPKPLTAYCRTVSRDRVPVFLEDLVRKGETFLYFGERDPFPDRTALFRFSFGRFHAFPVAKFVCSDARAWNGPEFLLESGWYNRGCFVAEGAGVVRRMEAEFLEFLTLRQRTRASARQTVNLVWDLPETPPPGLLKEMLFCGRHTNQRVVVFRAVMPSADRASFDEAHDEFPTPRPSPVWLEHVLRGGIANTISWLLMGAWTIFRRAVGWMWDRIRGASARAGGGAVGAAKALHNAGDAAGSFVLLVAAGARKGGESMSGGFSGWLASWKEERAKKSAAREAEKAKRKEEWDRLHKAHAEAARKAKEAAGKKPPAGEEEKKTSRPPQPPAGGEAPAVPAKPGDPSAEQPKATPTPPDPSSAGKSDAPAPSTAPGISPASGPALTGKAALAARIKAKEQERLQQKAAKKGFVGKLPAASVASALKAAAPSESKDKPGTEPVRPAGGSADAQQPLSVPKADATPDRQSAEVAVKPDAEATAKVTAQVASPKTHESQSQVGQAFLPDPDAFGGQPGMADLLRLPEQLRCAKRCRRAKRSRLGTSDWREEPAFPANGQVVTPRRGGLSHPAPRHRPFA
jgi:hypothetical protein